MTDLEISKKLALAIGYLPEHIRTLDDETIEVYRPVSDLQLEHPFSYDNRWGGFFYGSWNVIGPIAERYNCFPRDCDQLPNRWESCGPDGEWVYGETPQKAIALAVINAN